MANIKARRKLSDLYQRGVEVRFGPDGGKIGPFKDSETGKEVPVSEDEVAMWVQPPSPLQREMALRDSQGARARSLVRAKREEDSEEYLTAMAFLADMSDETLIDYVLLSDADERRSDATREVLGEKEWENITELQEAMRQFDEMDPKELEDNPEYDALMELDRKFGQQVAEREREILDAAREVLQMQGRAAAERKALAKRAEMIGSQVFMAEYERQMLFYSVRDADDHGVLFFESAKELAGQDEEILNTLRRASSMFISDAGEAKNSQGAASGSDSSEPPKGQETSEASTRETVSA